MEALIQVACFLLFLGAMIFAFDRHSWIKEIEIDLKDLLGDSLVARDAADGAIKVHYQAQVNALKTLIRKHFKL